MKKLLLIVGMWGTLSFSAYADGVTALNNFLQAKNSNMSANFSQIVYGHKKNHVSNGTLLIARPNKFRWNYVTDEQLIVSDGKIVSIYDKPLRQVTRRQLSNTLGKSPAWLLAGGTNIKAAYVVTPLPSKDGIDWVNLAPRNNQDNNGFQLVQIAFKHNVLAQMTFIDNFGSRSTIVFTNVKTGIAIPRDAFVLKTESQVDVINSGV